MADERHEEEAVLEAAFVAGFREAADKQAFLQLVRIPFTLRMPDGTGFKLVDVRIEDRIRVGAASPGFGTRELAYQPLPAALVRHETTLAFVYVSAEEAVEKTLAELMHLGDRRALRSRSGVGSALRLAADPRQVPPPFSDH
jgi:hypothetical protein